MNVKNVSIYKIVACLTALFIFAFSMNYYSPSAKASNTTRGYKIFDASTNECIYEYSLNALTNTYPATRSVIGNENRGESYKDNGVVKIITNLSSGTGFVVDKHTIATAAHCIYNANTTVSISEILLFDENTSTTGNAQAELSATPVEYHIPLNFISAQDDDTRSNYDYALITVEEDLTDYLMFDMGVVLDSALNQIVSVSGFPYTIGVSPNETTVNTSTIHNLYKGNGYITDLSNPLKIWYDTDTSGGNSGSPVYYTYTYNGIKYNVVIGINTSGGVDANAAIRITTDQLHFYKNNPYIAW